MNRQLKFGDITVDVVLKNIKNVYLSVQPPRGRVHISAPSRMSLDNIRMFAISKLDWIKKQQKKLRDQERETPSEYLDRESYYVWGKRYLLSVIVGKGASSIELKHDQMLMYVRPGTNKKRHQVLLEGWYRGQLKSAVPPLITKWEPLLGVEVNQFFVRRMKTKWGSCNPKAGNIRLNTQLATKPPECLEYIIVHEMMHLLEPTHNSRFRALMDRFMPNWQFRNDQLNLLPLRHEYWRY
jgi:predicted metal-dependent hydrolase